MTSTPAPTADPPRARIVSFAGHRPSQLLGLHTCSGSCSCSPRTALINGGTTGIGLAMAALLHKRGYRVTVTGANPDTIAVAHGQLPDDVVIVRAHARSLPDAERVAEQIRQQFGTLSTLFLNAGISRRTPLDTVDEAPARRLCLDHLHGRHRRHPPPTRCSVTAVSRGALLAMIPSLALELAQRRIRVNAVSPGAIDTPIWAKSGSPRPFPAQMIRKKDPGMAAPASKMTEDERN